jgi:hypothetical protein
MLTGEAAEFHPKLVDKLLGLVAREIDSRRGVGTWNSLDGAKKAAITNRLSAFAEDHVWEILDVIRFLP